jgi:hypothetical protein
MPVNASERHCIDRPWALTLPRKRKKFGLLFLLGIFITMTKEGKKEKKKKATHQNSIEGDDLQAVDKGSGFRAGSSD